MHFAPLRKTVWQQTHLLKLFATNVAQIVFFSFKDIYQEKDFEQVLMATMANPALAETDYGAPLLH